eukprot:3878494-Rhodomonas_salina.3
MPRGTVLCLAIIAICTLGTTTATSTVQSGWLPSRAKLEDRVGRKDCGLRLRGGHGSGYSLGIRDSIMIAHSFKGKEFGPAQEMHGATFTVDVEFHVQKLTEKLNWVMDIGEATTIVKDVLSKYNLKNLDTVFPGGENTTTEFMCKTIFDDIAAKVKGKVSGSLTIKLWESHSAWGTYHADI